MEDVDQVTKKNLLEIVPRNRDGAVQWDLSGWLRSESSPMMVTSRDDNHGVVTMRNGEFVGDK